MNRANLDVLVCAQDGGRWSAYIHFKNAPAGAPNCIGLPPELRQATAIEAFMTAAQIVCFVVIGEDELPFSAVGNTLMFATYGRDPAQAGKAQA